MIAIPSPIFTRHDRQQPPASPIDAERTQLVLEQFHAAVLVKDALRNPMTMAAIAERHAERVTTQWVMDLFEAALTNDPARAHALALEAFGAAVKIEAESLAIGQLEDVIASKERELAERLAARVG